jgi:hypothetical protein
MNGWRNRETWLVSLWFKFNTEEELNDIRCMLEEELEEVRDTVPDYLVDMLGVNFVMEEIDWDELAGHCEAMP